MIDRHLRHLRAGDRRHHLGAVLGDAAGLRRLADHEARDVLQEQQGDAALAGELDEVRGLERGLGIEDAVVGEDRHGQPLDVGEARHQRLRVVGLELVHLAAIDQAGDDLARVVLGHERGRHHAVDLGRIVGRRARRPHVDVDLLHRVEVGDDVAHDLQGMRVVERIVIGDARLARVHLGAAQLLGAHRLAGCGLHQRRAGEEDGALPAHDDRTRPTSPARRRRPPCTSP